MKQWLTSQGFEHTFLDSDNIRPGADWEQTLYREVERTQAMVLVITPAWMASKWCFAEFAQARALGKKIFLVIHSEVGESIVGQDLQSIDLTQDRGHGLERLNRELQELSGLSPEGFDLPRGVAPFPGLTAFEEQHAAVFFGRDPEVRKALERLRFSRTRGGTRLMLVLGPSGIGKSSFLRAGLIPRLRRDKANWIVLPPFRPEHEPATRLVDCLLNGLPDAGQAQADAWRQGLRENDPVSAIRDLGRALRLRHGVPDAGILVPIDQFEEVITRADAGERTGFLALLSHLAAESSPFLITATLRSDYLPSLQREMALTAPYEPFTLDPMPLDRIGDLIRGPARVAHVRVEEGLVAQLTLDAKTTDALPLVAAALEELYRRFGDSGTLTLAAYESLGAPGDGLRPLGNIIRERAQAALAGVTQADDERALRDAFVIGLVNLARKGGDFVRKPALLSALSEPARPLIERLVEARLLTRRASDAGDGDTLVEVAHESLFQVWPLLAGWLREEEEFLLARTRFDQAFEAWCDLSQAKRPLGLLTGIALEQGRDWLRAHPRRFSALEQDFIRQSDAAAAAKLKREKREARLKFILVASVAVVLGIGFVTSNHYYEQQKEAAQQAERALAAATTTVDEVLTRLESPQMDQVHGFESIETPLVGQLVTLQRQLVEISPQDQTNQGILLGIKLSIREASLLRGTGKLK